MRKEVKGSPALRQKPPGRGDERMDRHRDARETAVIQEEGSQRKLNLLVPRPEERSGRSGGFGIFTMKQPLKL